MFMLFVPVLLLLRQTRKSDHGVPQDDPSCCLRKKKESEELSVKEDCFSKLPDELVCHILTFLPTLKDVVRTSILAKRWKLLWTCAGNLVFDSHLVVQSDDALARIQRFREIVYHVLQQLHNSPRLRKMHLDCSNLDCNANDISNWISFSVVHKVEVLVLKMRGYEIFNLPQGLFNCETLVQFTLHGGSIVVGDVGKVPFFPILQKLELRSSRYQDEFCFQDLISRCSTLRYLSASVDPHLPICNIFSPSLEELRLWFDDFESRISNHKAVHINAPALEILHISGKVKRGIFIEDISSLVKAIISTDYDNIKDIVFIKGLSNVKFLSWGDQHVKRMQPLKLVPALPVEFHNLIELEIDQCEMNLLKSLMEKSKNLEVILLFVPPFSAPPNYLKEQYHVYWIEPETVPDCLLSRVKKITIKGSPGKDELLMIMYLLKNAKVLKLLELRPKEFSPDFDTELQMLRKIGEFPRASQTCEITYVRP